MSFYESMQREYPINVKDIWDAENGYKFLEGMEELVNPTFFGHWKYQNTCQTSSAVATSIPSSIPSQSCPSYVSSYFPRSLDEDLLFAMDEPLNSCRPLSAPPLMQYTPTTFPVFTAKPPVCIKPKAMSAPVNSSSFSLLYNEGAAGFTDRILCYYTENGSVPVDCKVCNSASSLEVVQGTNAIMQCNHYVVCNECRGRTVRRLLRCVECCEELTGQFPVCGDDCVQITSDKEPSNTGSCPRCEKKLRREVCGSKCNRRASPEYNDVRNQLNSMVAVMVQNPADCLNQTAPGLVLRPCSHYSYCAIHNEICKGHGKDITCYKCKGQRKSQKIGRAHV